MKRGGALLGTPWRPWPAVFVLPAPCIDISTYIKGLFFFFLPTLSLGFSASAFFFSLLREREGDLWREDKDGESLRSEIDRLWWAVTFLTADGPPGIDWEFTSLAAVHAHLRSTFPTHVLFLACKDGQTDRHEQERTGWWQIG